MPVLLPFLVSAVNNDAGLKSFYGQFGKMIYVQHYGALHSMLHYADVDVSNV